MYGKFQVANNKAQFVEKIHWRHFLQMTSSSNNSRENIQPTTNDSHWINRKPHSIFILFSKPTLTQPNTSELQKQPQTQQDQMFCIDESFKVFREISRSQNISACWLSIPVFLFIVVLFLPWFVGVNNNGRTLLLLS